MSDIASLGLMVRSDGVVVATKRLRELEGQSVRNEGAAARLNKSLMGMAAGFAAVTAATFGMQAIVSTLAGFEKSMAAVAAITRATDAELAALRDTAKQLGATTEFTASQAADALKFLGMAGWSASQSMAAIPAVLDLATAAQMDLARAADITSNIMTAFGLAASEAGKAADVLAAVSSRANTDVSQLGDGMKYVGPVAAALGISMGDAAAAMGALSDAGIQGSMAGTGLRRVLSSLANPTKQAADTLKGMGLELDKLNPATTSIVDIVQQLSDAGLDAAQALTIFGDRGGPAILALVENNAKLRALTGELKNVDGEAKRMADTMRDQLQGNINGLMSALEGLIIQMGESGLTNAIGGLIQGFTAFARALTDVIKIAGQGISAFVEMTGISDAMGKSAGGLGSIFSDLRGYIIAAALAATAYYTPAMIGLAGSVMGAVFSLGALKGALIATGIGAAVVAVGFLINEFLKLSDAVGGFGNAMVYVKELGLEVWDRLKLGGGALVEGYKAYTASFILLWQEAFASVINLFADFIDTILDGTRNAMLGAGNVAGAAAIEASRAAIKASIGQMQEGANAAVETQKELVSEHFKNAQQMAKDALAPLYMWQALNDVIDAAKQKAGAGAGGAVPGAPVIPDDLLGGGALGGLNDNEESILQRLTRENKELQALREAIRQGDEAYQAMAETIEIDNLLREAGIERKSKEGEAIAELVRQQNYLNAAIEAGRNAGLGGVMSDSDRTRSRERFEDLGKDLRGGMNDPFERLRQENEERLKIVADYEKAYTDKTEEAEKMRAEIREQYQMAQTQLMLSSAEQGFGALAQIIGAAAGETSAAYKVLFGISKGFAIAQSAIAMYQAIAEAMKVGWPANIALMAQAASQGAMIISSIQSLQPKGFMEGGYTGNMGIGQVAGVVHGQEFVAHAEATRRWRPQLEAMNAGTYRPANDNGGSGTTVHINNYAPGVEHEVRQIGPDEIEIIARRVVGQEAPGVVAGAIREPNSVVSKALRDETTAQRRRA